ncbi:MAG: RNA polymerase factor sigma-32 [Bdellovibrio sp.]|nr:RNA polymerase factor sigma-32 [Bdellovibrio sp.]
MAVKKKVVRKIKPTKAKVTKKPVADDEHRAVQAEVVSDDEPLVLKPTDEESNESDFDGRDVVEITSKKTTETSLTTTRDPLSLYLSEVRKYPVLSREQELEFAKKYYESKDPAIAQTLVKSNLRFVVKIAAEYAKFSNKLIDVIQEGNVGLMHAVKEFNPYKGNRLITYAVWWIRGYIQEYLMRQFSMVRIGTTANQRKLFYQLQRQKQELEKMSSSENIALISHKLGIPQDEVTEMAKRLSSRDVSLDKPAGGSDESATPLSALLRKEDGSLPLDEQLALEEQLSLLMSAIDSLRKSLNEREKILLEERILSDEPLTLQEIGDKYGISREAVRQTEARLMKKIREAMIATST